MSAANPDGPAARLVPPTGWGVQGRCAAAPRLSLLDGVTLGLLANGKANSDAILDAVADALANRHRIAGVVRVTKPHPSLPASGTVVSTFAERAQVVLTAIGD